MIKLLFILFSLLVNTFLFAISKEEQESKVLNFEAKSLIEEIIRQQTLANDIRFELSINIFQDAKTKIQDINHPLKLSLKSCFVDMSSGSVFKECLEKIAALKLTSKIWMMRVELLPYKFFAEEELRKIENKNILSLQDFSKDKTQETAKSQLTATSILLNNSIPVNQDPYQYLGSIIDFYYENLEDNRLVLKNYYKINRKIEALLNLEPPLSLSLLPIAKGGPYLSLHYYLTLNKDGNLRAEKALIYPGKLVTEGISHPETYTPHQLLIHQHRGDELIKLGQIDTIIFNYPEERYEILENKEIASASDILAHSLGLKYLLYPSEMKQ